MKFDSKIIGGTNARLYELPYQVVFFLISKTKDFYKTLDKYFFLGFFTTFLPK